MSAKRLLKVLVVGTLAFGALACSNGGGGSGGQVSPEEACSNQFQASNGIEIPLSRFITGTRHQWKIQNLDIFQKMQSKSDDNKFLYVGYAIKVAESDAQFAKVCGGGSPEFEGNFTYSVPSIVRAKDGEISKKVEGKIKGNPNGSLTHYASFVDGSGKFGSGDLPPGGKIKLQVIADNVVEVWIFLPVDSREGKGRFVLRYTYKSFAPEPMDLLKEAFSYAHEATYRGGLGLNRDAAQAFAEKVSAIGGEAGYAYLDAFREAFTYGLEPTYRGGPGLSSERDMAFSDAVAKSLQPEVTLSKFKKAFSYALEPTYRGGMGLGQEEALKFAARQAGIQF